MEEKEEQKELPSLREKPKEKKSFLSRFLLILNIVLFVCIAIASVPAGIMIYRNVAFGDAYFINGMSMYPTLNRNSLNKNGNQKFWNAGESSAGDLVDYGWGKANNGESFFTSLKRYDVVYTYFPTDYTDSPTYSRLMKNAALKIKRVVGLPGETVNITYDSSLDGTFYGNSVWGKTTITKASGETTVLENLYSEENYPDVAAGTSTLKYTSVGFTHINVTRTLGNDEYFLVGDNRRGNYSYDSRTVGPIKGTMIQGKACLITGMREIVQTEDGYEPKFRFDKIRMPWDYENLEA